MYRWIYDDLTAENKQIIGKKIKIYTVDFMMISRYKFNKESASSKINLSIIFVQQNQKKAPRSSRGPTNHQINRKKEKSMHRWTL